MSSQEKIRLLCHLGFHMPKQVIRFTYISKIDPFSGGWKDHGHRCKYCGRKCKTGNFGGPR